MLNRQNHIRITIQGSPRASNKNSTKKFVSDRRNGKTGRPQVWGASQPKLLTLGRLSGAERNGETGASCDRMRVVALARGLCDKAAGQPGRV
jgi:hypothetical protein